jgi:ABC-type multidrug transport system fused ATPase/permease subunit
MNKLTIALIAAEALCTLIGIYYLLFTSDMLIGLICMIPVTASIVSNVFIHRKGRNVTGPAD